MKSKVIKACFCFAVVSGCANGHAQDLSRDALLRRANYFAERLDASGQIEGDASVERIPNSTVWSVSGREITMSIFSDETLGSFSDLRRASRLPLTGNERYRTASDALESVGSLLDSVGLETNQILKRSHLNDDSPCPILVLVLGPSPHHYETYRNETTVEVHRITGRLLSVRRGLPWSFEPPNVRVSQDDAIRKAIDLAGGNFTDWSATLLYRTPPPSMQGMPGLRDLQRRRVERLCYYLQSSFGHVLVDTVTGDASSFDMHVENSSASHSIPPRRANASTNNWIGLVVAGTISTLALILALWFNQKSRTRKSG